MTARSEMRELMTHRARILFLILIAVPTFVSAQRPNAGTAPNPARNQGTRATAQLPRGATSADWPGYGGTPLAWRYSALGQINTTNVKKLVPAWSFETGDYQDGLLSTPIVIDGIVYISSASSYVFALNGTT